jgi:hypothetical protein
LTTINYQETVVVSKTGKLEDIAKPFIDAAIEKLPNKKYIFRKCTERGMSFSWEDITGNQKLWRNIDDASRRKIKKYVTDELNKRHWNFYITHPDGIDNDRVWLVDLTEWRNDDNAVVPWAVNNQSLVRILYAYQAEGAWWARNHGQYLTVKLEPGMMLLFDKNEDLLAEAMPSELPIMTSRLGITV